MPDRSSFPSNSQYTTMLDWLFPREWRKPAPSMLVPVTVLSSHTYRVGLENCKCSALSSGDKSSFLKSVPVQGNLESSGKRMIGRE